MSLEPNPELSPHPSNNETVTSPLPDPESIIKENRMIVRIEYTHQHVLPQIYNEHTTRHQTYSVGWREYMVILRQQRLEFLKNRTSRAETVLFTSSTRFSIFSPLDITLSLTRPCENGIQIIIFRPQTRALAVEWYVTLRTLLPDAWPKFKPTSCEVLIPVLNDVRINIPLLSNCSAHGFTLDGIMETVLSELRGVNEWDDVLNELLKTENLKLGWKRYDRIEWISPDWSNQADLLSCPQFIEGTHQLQLRKSKHYPTQVTNPDGIKSDEPVSIEGYLALFSTHKGKKKKIPKRRYFTSHDHYLFYMKPKDAISLTVQNQSSDLLFTFQPPHHQHNQSAGASNTPESEQRFHQLKMTRGFYDLANVVEIKPVESGEAFEAPSHQRVNEAMPPTTGAEGELNNTFQIILNNGLGITLQAASPENMTKWIDRLNDLVRYWHLRLAADVQIRLRVMSENRNIDGDDDENISRGRFTINSYFNNGIRAFTDSTIWNWCVLEGCRSITLSGKLYHKSHYHSTFVNYQHILTRGHLIYYKLHSRSTMGKSQPHTYNKRSGIISLRDCYIYSGSLTEHDLLYHHHNDPALVDKFPRVYADGMHCDDQEEECTFVIWKSVRRRVLGKNVDMIMFKKGLRFGSVGNVWVFKARSRIEKLEWVIALNREIQRVWDPDE